MSDDKLISELKLSINELKQLIEYTNDKSNMTSETETKKANLISTIVNYFYQILSFLFQSGQNYWDFISKHVNGSVTTFCIIYEKDELNEEEIEIEEYEKKGKYWILFNILENSFLESMKHIINYLEENDECNNANIQKFLIEYKKDFILILKELNEFKLNNIIDEDYKNYLNFLEKTQPENQPESKLFNQSPILKNRNLDKKITNKEKELFSFFEGEHPGDNSIIDEPYKEIDFLFNLEIKEPINEIRKTEEFEFQKFGDIKPSIVDNFYNFIPKVRSNNIIIPNDEEINSNIIINTQNENEDEFLFKDLRRNSGLKLSTEVNYRNLPSDDLYDLQGNNNNNYAINDEFFYNKKKKKMMNIHLLYIKNFYKKARYYKFYVRNTHTKSISLKEQNYQCFICLHKFDTLLGFPTEPIYWCSYYMRFVCKNCIASDFSFIPQLILKEWCFDKCPISTKAKNFIKSWYDKPIIYLKKKDDELLKHIPKSVLYLKKDLKKIFNFMKCEKAFDFLDEKIPEYKYIFLKENIFSIKDLVDIHNRTFTKKLKEIKNIFIKHLIEECEKCKYEGNICPLCQREETIYFYNTENISYCKKCGKCIHKECKNLNITHNCH